MTRWDTTFPGYCALEVLIACAVCVPVLFWSYYYPLTAGFGVGFCYYALIYSILPSCTIAWCYATRSAFNKTTTYAIRYVTCVIILASFLVSCNFLRIYGSNLQPPTSISVMDVHAYSKDSDFVFTDGDIIADYFECSTFDKSYVVIAPLVSSAADYNNNSAIPAFVVAKVKSQKGDCVVPYDANWNVSIRAGVRARYSGISKFIGKAYKNLNLTEHAAKNVFVWKPVHVNLHEAREKAFVSAILLLGLFGIVFVVSCFALCCCRRECDIECGSVALCCCRQKCDIECGCCGTRKRHQTSETKKHKVRGCKFKTDRWNFDCCWRFRTEGTHVRYDYEPIGS